MLSNLNNIKGCADPTRPCGLLRRLVMPIAIIYFSFLVILEIALRSSITFAGSWRPHIELGMIALGFLVGLLIAMVCVVGTPRSAWKTYVGWCLLAICVSTLSVGIFYARFCCEREEAARIRSFVGFRDAILMYVSSHDGNLPPDLATMCEAGYLRRLHGNTWEAPQTSLGVPLAIQNPEGFDVAWGIHMNDIDRNGFVVSRSRPVVRPAAGATAFFESGSQTISQSLGWSLEALKKSG